MGAENGGNGSGNAAKAGVALAGVAALVAPLGAAIGVLAATGPIGRIQRDEPKLIFWALVLLLIAGSLWVVANLINQKEQPVRGVTWTFLAGVALALLGFCLAFLAVVGTADDSPRPQIHAKLNKKRTNVKVQVSASSMASDERLSIQIVALKRKGHRGELNLFRRHQQLYRAVVGPDNDGDVSQTFSAPVPRSRATDIAINASTGDNLPTCQDSKVPTAPTPNQQISVDQLSGGASAEESAGCVIVFVKKRFGKRVSGT